MLHALCESKLISVLGSGTVHRSTNIGPDRHMFWQSSKCVPILRVLALLVRKTVYGATAKRVSKWNVFALFHARWKL
jgi:hypothetical protein